jgi:AraC-like DNA-binding protein
MGVVIRGPSLPLTPFVERLGYYTGGCADGWEPVPPTGTDHLLVNLGSGEFDWSTGTGSAITRVSGGAVVVPGSESRLRVNLGQWRSAVFVCFHPGGAYPFLGMAPATAGGPLLELRTVWGRGGELLCDRLAGAPTAEAALVMVEEALLTHAVLPLRPDPVVQAAVTALDCGVPVAQVAAGLGVSQSTLLRRFTAQVGLPPKRLARVRRLRRLLAAAHGWPGTDWAGAAAQCGYFDQAHMIADFRDLASMTPEQYRPRLREPYDPRLSD